MCTKRISGYIIVLESHTYTSFGFPNFLSTASFSFLYTRQNGEHQGCLGGIDSWPGRGRISSRCGHRILRPCSLLSLKGELPDPIKCALLTIFQYTCYGDFLCPILNGDVTLKCGNDCYLSEMYSYVYLISLATKLIGYRCKDGHLMTPETSSCRSDPTALHLSSPPYENYFYSDCHSASQVVVTSPTPESNLSIIGPRVIVAWPAGNSGIAAYFQPESGINGTLGIQLVNSTSGSPLSGIYDESKSSNSTIGISTQIEFNSSAVLSVAILGSIRTIRDFVEGPSLLYPVIQNATNFSAIQGGVEITRLWLDNITTTTLSFISSNQAISLNNRTVIFPAGAYTMNVSFDYPQLTQLSSKDVLSPASGDLITQSPMQTTSLSFLSYTTKLTAGAWRFLTYFGRDSMISALLLQPVLSEGKGGAIEAVIAGVLERVNRTDGSVCHEETIGYVSTIPCR